jgi:hypothetical protein
VRRHPFIKSLRDSPGNAGNGVAVTAYGNGFSDSILKIPRFKEGPDGLRDRTLAGLIKLVGRPDFIQRERQVITEIVFYAVLDFFFTGPLAGQ